MLTSPSPFETLSKVASSVNSLSLSVHLKAVCTLCIYSASYYYRSTQVHGCKLEDEKPGW